MTTLNEKEKRDFVSQTVAILKQNADMLAKGGFDSSNKTTGLKEK